MNKNLLTDGYIIINKPCGWTSFDCVNYLKRKYHFKKAGHAGSLDPIAEGLLIIMVNRATKWFDNFQIHPKAYTVKMLLGVSFDSGDITGKITNFSPPAHILKKDEIIDVLNSFRGETVQTPPKYSAIKIKGKPSYKYARKGSEVEIKPRKAFIEQISLLEYEFPNICFEIKCKKGFYVRSLCEDIAKKLNTLGTMTYLFRTSQSGHSIKEAVDFNNLPDNILPYIKQQLVN